MADLKKEILAISRRPENALCVDCRMHQPTWASFNLGVFMCMTCAGHHRSLGTHITRVRSVTMDNWDAPSVALMGSVGNIRANSYFEAKLQPHQKIHPGVDDNARREFITAKYVNRAFYAAPAEGTAAASAPVAEVKPLSKMEQRQLRLQAKQAGASSTPQPTSSASPAPIPQPSAPIRQSSTPVPTHSANPDANLFAGMNVAKPAAAAVVAAPVPVPAAAPKVHSSSPWVTREQHQQIQQQHQPQNHHLQQPHHHMSHSSSFPNNSSNILDFSAPAPAAAAASNGGVDDMFAGLSVANTSASASPSIAGAPAAATNGAAAAAAGAKLNSSELLSFYAYEPASAPARSQHQPSGSVSVGASPAVDMFGSLNTNQHAVQYAAPVDPSASTSSFSFLSEPTVADPAPASTASAFSFLGGDDHHVPATTTTSASPLDNFSDLLPPADSASAPPLLPTPDLAAFASQPAAAAALQPLPFLNNVTMPAMVGQPPQGFLPMGNGMDPNMNPMAMQGMVGAPYGMPNGGVGMGGVAPGMMNPAMGLLFPTNMPLIPALAQQPLHGHSLLPSSSPMFMVQSVQATQAAAQQQATALANDPFAHINVTAASPAPAPTVSPTQQNLAPKQPHQCDVDGCHGKKVSRGLCAKHIRGVDGGAAVPASAPAADSTFGFLSATNSAALQQPAPVEASGFGFI